MKKLTFKSSSLLSAFLILISAVSVNAQSNTTVYPSSTAAAPAAPPIPPVLNAPVNAGNTLFDDGTSSQWQATTFLRSVNVGPFANSGTSVTFPDFNILRVGENYNPTPVRMQLFGGNLVQTPSIEPFPDFNPLIGRRYNAIGDRVPFGGNFPGVRTSGLRTQWDLYAANFGLTDAAATGNMRNALISWQDATTTNIDDVENRLVFGKRDGTTTNFEELATILGNGNMGIGIANPIIKLQVQLGNIGQTSAGTFGVIDPGNRWTAIGGRVPFGSSNPLIRQEGIRTQWNRFGVGLGLTDRAGVPYKDAILTWQDVQANFTSGTLPRNNFILGVRDGVGSGATAANYRKYMTIRGDNGNISIGLNVPLAKSKVEIFGDGVTDATSALNVRDQDGNTILFARDDIFVGIGIPVKVVPIGGFAQLAGTGPNPPPLANIRLSVSGDITQEDGDFATTGDVYALSDERLKKDFVELKEEDAWKSILNITPYSYKFDQSKVDNVTFDPRTRYGFKAQDVAKNIPELTKGWGEAIVVNYQGFVPFLAAGLQEHEQEIDDVMQENKLIKEANEKIVSENVELKTQIQSLEDKLNQLYNLPAIKEAIEQTEQNGTLDAQPKLYQNEPNPFGSKTIIRYFVPTGANTALIKVVDNSGAEMGRYKIQKGAGQLEITAGTIPAGNYNYSLYIDNQLIDTKKMVIINY